MRTYHSEFFGSPASTLISIGDCECRLVSIDCLDSIRCLPGNTQQQLRLVYEGVLTRSVVKESSTIGTNMGAVVADMPLGKIFQLIVTDVWQTWLSTNTIPQGLGNEPDAFVNHERYPFCQKNNLLGRYCFVNDFSAEEEYGQIERDAVAKFRHTRHSPQEKETKLKLTSLQRYPFAATSLDYLLTFANIARITLNFRSHVLDLYHNHTITIDNRRTNKTSLHKKRTPFRVAIHVRRGDACQHKKSGYEISASPLNSRAQMGATRLCYDTAVYMSALQRIVRLVPAHRHVIVYLSTDHSQSLMEEIKTDFKELYQSVSWKYLQYSRNIFDYFRGKKEDDGDNYIESPANKFRDLLGETAIADLWHLSHGEVFIGHLGSRFGKLGWFLATARYNSFIPFFTVDGHSVCCDIDEACGDNAEHVVSMENCIGKFWAASEYTSNIDPYIYFTTGAYFRKAAAMDELKFRGSIGM